MPSPELCLVQGKDSIINRFKRFVVTHSIEIEFPTEETRLGSYHLSDATQLVPIDEVEFKVMDTEGASTYYIKLNISTDSIDPTAYEVWYDDDPDGPQFYDKDVNPISDIEALQLITKLDEAEEAGRLRA